MNDLIYTDISTTSLYTIPTVGQTLTVQDSSDIQNQSYYISTRNQKNFYEIPINLIEVFLNFVAKKTLILDINIKKISNTDFEYFTDSIQVEDTTIPLLDGMIFRCLGEGLRDLRSYTYYIYQNNKPVRIPDFQTLEVMISERGISYTSIRVLTQRECSLLGNSEMMLTRFNEWNSSLGDSTGFTTLSQLSQNISTLNQITAALGGSVAQEQTNINNQLAAQSAAMQASAAAAQAQADAASAANTAAQAALAQAAAAASSAQAQADAAALALAESSTS